MIASLRLLLPFLLQRSEPMEPSRALDAPVRHDGGGCGDVGRTAASWAALPQDLLEQVLGSLLVPAPDRTSASVATAAAAMTCKQWAPVARVVRLRAQLEEALIEPEELIWRRYSGGAERMGREGCTRFMVEVLGHAEGMGDASWARNAASCGGSAADGIGREGFIHGLYTKAGRDAAADADALTDESALRALTAEAKACGPSLRDLCETLEARLAEAARKRPLLTASVAQLVEMLVTQRGDADMAWRCCRQLSQRIRAQPANQTAAEQAGGSNALAAVLHAHTTDAVVQSWGLTALSNLMANHPANQTAVAAAGGIEVVLAAMLAHPGAEVHTEGCSALGNMASDHSANQTAMAAAGGIEVIVAALRAHPGTREVSDFGLYALYSLARNHPANSAVAAGAGAIDLAEAACGRLEAGTQAHTNAACCRDYIAQMELLRLGQ
jgi:hypothetical protein